MPGLHDVIEETVPLHGRALNVLRPRDSESLLDEEAFDQEEYLPYWADLWPSAIALARAVSARSLKGARTLELGCGLGLPSIAAALAGGRVLATDWSEDAMPFVRANAERNEAELEMLVCSWAEPEPIVERAPWDLVLASDVIYEKRSIPLLLDLLPRLVDQRGEVWLADPGRALLPGFRESLERDWNVVRTAEDELPNGGIYRLRLR